VARHDGQLDKGVSPVIGVEIGAAYADAGRRD